MDPLWRSRHIQVTFQLLEEPTGEASADADTLSQIITLIKILRIKWSLIKDPVKLWECQFSGPVLLYPADGELPNKIKGVLITRIRGKVKREWENLCFVMEMDQDQSADHSSLLPNPGTELQCIKAEHG